MYNYELSTNCKCNSDNIPMSTALQYFFTEPAVFCGEQVATAGHDGGVLWQWLCVSLHCRQTSDPETLKCLRAVAQPSR